MTTNNSVNTTLSGQTGTGTFVGATSPTLVTPNVGVATATSLTFGGGVLNTYTAATTWTPVVTFATPGNLSVSYATQVGYYLQIGGIVFYQFSMTFTPTFTTASGNFRLTGLPVTVNANSIEIGAVATVKGITYPATTTYITCYANTSTTYVEFLSSGTGTNGNNLQATNFTTTVQAQLIGSGYYFT